MASDKSNSLNAPDAFQVQAYSVMDRAARNPKPLIIVGSLLLAAVVAGYAFVLIRDNQVEKRQEALSKIDLVFEEEVKKANDAREVLDAQRNALLAKQPTAAGQSAPPSPEIAALDEKMRAIKPDHAASSTQYGEYYKANPKTSQGLLAGLRQASFLAEQGKIDEARPILESVVADSTKFSIIQVQSLLLLISIVQDKGDFDAAVKHSDELIKAVGPELKAKALLTKAQALYLKKDFAGAKSTLETIEKDHGASPEAERARGLLSLIPA